MPSSIEDLRAALAGRYEIERQIGQGGMATVYLADDVRHQRKVAVKVLRPDLAAALGGERFLREIRIAANLTHPHILPLFDSGEAEGFLYYVMPYIKGHTLREHIEKEGELQPSEAMRLLREVVDGIAHAHRHGVVHRDIKPDNVMIAERHALVMDFGVAKAMTDAGAHHELTSVGISLGTPTYMAPEQATADPNIDHRADIYSVGVMAYEMLSGKPPFEGTPQAVLASQITATPEPLLDRKSNVPPDIAKLVMTCLEKAPGDRYQTTDDLLQAIDGLVTPTGAMKPAPATPEKRTRRMVLGVVALAAVAAVAFVGVRTILRDRWVHQTAIPEMRRMIEDGELDSAYYLGLEVDATPGDSTLAAIWPIFTRVRAIKTRPEGVEVYRASFSDTSQWHHLGTTPIDSIQLSRQLGLFRFEKEGFRPLYSVRATLSPPVLLDAIDAPDPEMIRIAGGRYGTFLVGADGSPALELGDWQMDRYETTNREYKAFVDAGGYRDSTWWEYPFRDEGRTLSREEAMARFVDQSGRRGPATWVAGDYPSGGAELPVGGVSWYEAAAYAKFKGKALPTIYHWATAAGIYYSRRVVPESNMEGNGPWPVGTQRAVSVTGISDMAGNVREWNQNEAGRDERFILGGGWSDPTYAFVDAYAQPSMDRSVINGIRLVRYDVADTNVTLAMGPITRKFTDYPAVASVSDPVFEGFARQFDYDPLLLDATVERADSTSEEWHAEFVSFTAAYGGERMYAWVFLPKHGTPPYQTVIFFPGSGAINTLTSAERRDMTASFVVKSGRAFVLPVFKSTYERSDSLTSDIADESIFWRDHVVMWGKDYRRTLDYLSSRPDIDSDKFAYFGYSWGGNMGGLIPAIEPRLKASVLYVAGFGMERPRPEVDPVNFLPHIRIPVLMLNGKYDFYFPPETSQRPFFERFGTPAADKRYVVYEGGHDVPRPQLIAETLEWLDNYLGPVQ